MNKLELYLDKDGQKLRCGYTTGSTATAAAKAALTALLNQEEVNTVEIDTPAGIVLNLSVNSLEFNDEYAIASVIKDGGDDIDATDGIEIFAKVYRNKSNNIVINGGEGIGKITKKGLYGYIGDYAINPTPKEMIRKEIRKLSNSGYTVEIFAPEGALIAKQTYNRNIGIVDGISIIGTKGIVYPMSEEAYLKTIYMEIDSIEKNYGLNEPLVLTPGNYGEKFSQEHFPNSQVVQVSNYIGKSLKYAYNTGFRDFILIGHIGKFSKLSIGIFNTHNEVADTRMEAIVYYMAMKNVDHRHIVNINEVLTGEEASEYLAISGLGYIIKDMEDGASIRIKKYLKDEDINVKTIIYSFKRGVDFD